MNKDKVLEHIEYMQEIWNVDELNESDFIKLKELVKGVKDELGSEK